MHLMPTFGALACAAALAACSAPLATSPRSAPLAAPPPTPTDERIAALASSAPHRDVITIGAIGASREGRPLHLIRVAAPSGDYPDPDRRPALLIVAGVDPMHTVGTEVALRLAERLAADDDAKTALTRCTVYIIPQLNPDTAEWLRTQAVRRDHSRTLVPDDADRDRRSDEDGPEDLNGDGVITMMRIRHPRPGTGLTATHIIDDKDPRLLREPDPAKDERPTHALLVESRDADGDGRFAEDGPGGVHLDMNFPYRWPEFSDGAGITPLSEPETRALAEWILAPTGPGRDNLIAVLVYSPVDNILNAPQSGKMDETGRVPLGIEDGDKPAYESIARIFKDITRQTAAPKGDSRWPGSLAGWAYGHCGVLAFTTPIWVRPDQVKPEDKPAAPAGDRPAAAPSEPQAGGNPDGAEPGSSDPQRPPRGIDAAGLAQPAGRGGGRGGPPRGSASRETQAGGGAGSGATSSGASDDDAKWLAYFDKRAKEAADADLPPPEPGFIDWAPFNHPDLGPVEIGGFVPGARLNPPASELDRLADEQARFVTAFLGRFPRLRVEDLIVEPLGAGLFRITVRVINDGHLPTRSAIGVKARRLPPLRLDLDLPTEAVVGGDRVQRSDSIAAGASFTAEWVVARPSGDPVTLRLRSAELGDRDMTIPLTTPAAAPEGNR